MKQSSCESNSKLEDSEVGTPILRTATSLLATFTTHGLEIHSVYMQPALQHYDAVDDNNSVSSYQPIMVEGANINKICFGVLEEHIKTIF